MTTECINHFQAKGKYERAFRDSEKATDAYIRAEKDINLSRAEVSKVGLSVEVRGF